MTHLIATFFYVGHLRPAPGTWGSLAAIPVAWMLHIIGGWPLLMLATGVTFALGWWATAQEIKGKEDHDPSEIVIDEVVGQWIPFWVISIGATHAGVPLTDLWPGWIVAFLGFRLFDILKPGPVGWADRRGDALGVMLDDVIAGVFAAILVVALAWVSHGMFGI